MPVIKYKAKCNTFSCFEKKDDERGLFNSILLIFDKRMDFCMVSFFFFRYASSFLLLSAEKKKLIRDRVLEKDNGVYQHSFWIDNTAPLCWESQWDPLLTKKSDKGKNPHQRFGFYALKYMTAIELISYPDSTNLYVTIDSKIKKRTLVTNIYTTFLDTRLLDGSTCRYMMMALWDWQPTNPPIQKSKCFFD